MTQLRRWLSRFLLAIGILPFAQGCVLVPEVAHQPVIRNPFPQLSKIAVVEFVNQSDEPTMSGRRIADMYVNELQQFQGFEVLPVSVTMNVARDLQVNLANPNDRRRLAQALQVDAIVVGSITEYTPYYPPRCGLSVNWYAANSSFHPIPPGYGLPWGTSEEEFIPDSLIYEAEFALAKEQMKTQTPLPAGMPMPLPGAAEGPMSPQQMPVPLMPRQNMPAPGTSSPATRGDSRGSESVSPGLPLPEPDSSMRSSSESNDQPSMSDSDATEQNMSNSDTQRETRAVSHAEMIPTDGAFDAGGAIAPGGAMLPPDWPDPRGFVPPGPQAHRPPSRPSNEPVMRHTRIYHGNDTDFTTALAAYYGFRDEARYGGWQGYLQRSDDFLRFCCHKHIAEMLSARGGADKSRVVYRWRKDR